MKMRPLQSKIIDTVAYDEDSRRLVLHLANGHRREYADVPAYVVDDLQAAKSPGSYYFKMIKPKFALAY